MSYNNGSSSKSYALVVNQDGCVGLKTTTDQSITDSPLLPIVGHSANYVLPGDEKQHLDDIDDIIQMLRFGLGTDGTEQRCDATIGYLYHYLPAVNGGYTVADVLNKHSGAAIDHQEAADPAADKGDTAGSSSSEASSVDADATPSADHPDRSRPGR